LIAKLGLTVPLSEVIGFKRVRSRPFQAGRGDTARVREKNSFGKIGVPGGVVELCREYEGLFSQL